MFTENSIITHTSILREMNSQSLFFDRITNRVVSLEVIEEEKRFL